MVFVTLFTRLENVHLLKDVGMIPYILHRDHDFDSVMVTRKNDADYSYIDRELKGLRIRFIKGKGAAYLLHNSRKIDVLNVYHLNLQSFFNLLLFRILKRRNAKSYLKLDMDDRGFDRLFMKNPVGWIKRRTVDLADVVSVETVRIYKDLHEIYGDRIIYLPNGFYTQKSAPESMFDKKNVILTAGNLGTQAKATDILIKAFRIAAGSEHGWTLKLAGPVAEGFVNPCQDYPGVVFTGKITDRQELRSLYREAKVFAFPSRHESYGIVMTEAASCGDYIVSTDGVPAASDITAVTGAGSIVPADDTAALAGELKRLMEDKRDWNGEAESIAYKAYSSFRWEPIVSGLVDYIS